MNILLRRKRLHSESWSVKLKSKKTGGKPVGISSPPPRSLRSFCSSASFLRPRPFLPWHSAGLEHSVDDFEVHTQPNCTYEPASGGDNIGLTLAGRLESKRGSSLAGLLHGSCRLSMLCRPTNIARLFQLTCTFMFAASEIPKMAWLCLRWRVRTFSCGSIV